MKLGFYSLITPEYSPESIIPAAREWGFDGIEWRVAQPGIPRVGSINYWDGNICSLNPASLKQELPGLVQRGLSVGLQSFSLCPYLRCSESDALDQMFAIAAEAGVSYVRVSADSYDRARSYEAQFTQLRREAAKVALLAERRGVRVCMLQHAGTLIPSASACRRLVEDLDPKSFGLFLDVGHFVKEGYEDFGIVVDLLKDYLVEIHLRNGWLEPERPDASGFVGHIPRWGSLDQGHVNLGLLARSLGAINWQGWLVLEDFSMRPTQQRITEGLGVMRRMQDLARDINVKNPVAK